MEGSRAENCEPAPSAEGFHGDCSKEAHTAPTGIWSPPASAVKLALACAPQAGLKSLFLTRSRALCLQALPGGWVHHPPVSHSHMQGLEHLASPLVAEGLLHLHWWYEDSNLKLSEYLSCCETNSKCRNIWQMMKKRGIPHITQ